MISRVKCVKQVLRDSTKEEPQLLPNEAVQDMGRCASISLPQSVNYINQNLPMFKAICVFWVLGLIVVYLDWK